jgi:hypothetical protein
MFCQLRPVCPAPLHVGTEELSVVRHTQNLVSASESADIVAEDHNDASADALERYSSAYVWNCRVRR